MVSRKIEFANTPATVSTYLAAKIGEWYKDAKRDYGVKGLYRYTVVKGDCYLITWQEEGYDYGMLVPVTYDKETIFDIWMAQSLDVLKFDHNQNAWVIRDSGEVVAKYNKSKKVWTDAADNAVEW